MTEVPRLRRAVLLILAGFMDALGDYHQMVADRFYRRAVRLERRSR